MTSADYRLPGSTGLFRLLLLGKISAKVKMIRQNARLKHKHQFTEIFKSDCAMLHPTHFYYATYDVTGIATKINNYLDVKLSQVHYWYDRISMRSVRTLRSAVSSWAASLF